MCGCGRTSTPAPGANVAGPMWSKKMNGPTVCSPPAGSTRRTLKPPRSRGRPSSILATVTGGPSLEPEHGLALREHDVHRDGALRQAVEVGLQLRADHAEFLRELLYARVVAVALQPEQHARQLVHDPTHHRHVHPVV